MEEVHPQQEVDIQQYWLVLKRRWLVVAGTLAASVGVLGGYIIKQQPEYRASGMLLFKSDQISSLTKAGEKIGSLEPVIREGNPLETQAVIMKSQPILERVIKTLDLKDDENKPLSPELLKIEVEPVAGTDILKVSYTSTNSKLAASIVNKVMDTYVDNNIDTNRAQVYAADQFLKKQLPQTRAELERAAENLRQFKTRNQVIQLPQEATAAINNIAKLDEEMNQARAMLADVSAQEAKVSSSLKLSSQEAVEVTNLSQTPGIQQVLDELQKVQTKLAAERGRYSDDHPSIIYLKNQESALNLVLQQRGGQVLGTSGQIPTNKLQVGKIKQELASQYVQLQGQRQGIERKILEMQVIQASYQQRLNILPNLEKSLGDLERKLTLAQTNYQNLFTRLQEVEVAEKQTIGNARVVQPARAPKKPILSKLTLMLAGSSVFVGLLFGISAAFFIDLIDNSLKSIKEVEEFFDYTILGLIPKFESTSKKAPTSVMGYNVSPRVVTASARHTIIHDAYQMLLANLKFISHKKVCTIAVTSSVAGEGKSEVAANLAGVLAQSGRRVLLIDADMRKPMQHNLWGLINTAGLSNLIIGQYNFPQIEQKITECLSLLMAGARPPNPLALIDSERISSLINTFSLNYDYVIFDTPPLVGTADAAVLGKVVDGVLLVTRPGVVSLTSAKVAKSLLERSGANILGIVANAVNLKYEPGSYSYYSEKDKQDSTEIDTEIASWVYK